MSREDALEVAVRVLESAVDGVGPEAVQALERAAREQPRRGIRAKIRRGRLLARLRRVKARRPSAFRRLRAMVIEARLDHQDAILDALDGDLSPEPRPG